MGRGAWLDMPARHDRPGQVNSGGCTPRYAPYTRRKYKPAWTCQPRNYVGQFWLGHEELDYDNDCDIAWRYFNPFSQGEYHLYVWTSRPCWCTLHVDHRQYTNFLYPYLYTILNWLHSVFAHIPLDRIPYSASKFAVRGLMEALYVELRQVYTFLLQLLKLKSFLYLKFSS